MDSHTCTDAFLLCIWMDVRLKYKISVVRAQNVGLPVRFYGGH
jgi:hypothetical protein